MERFLRQRFEQGGRSWSVHATPFMRSLEENSFASLINRPDFARPTSRPSPRQARQSVATAASCSSSCSCSNGTTGSDGFSRTRNCRLVFDSNAAIESGSSVLFRNFPRSSEHEHEHEPLVADFGGRLRRAQSSRSVERFAALGAMQASDQLKTPLYPGWLCWDSISSVQKLKWRLIPQMPSCLDGG